MDQFPNEFLFGVTTSAFQTEGAWNEDGKGESIWDRFVHTQIDLIRDGSKADQVDISSDSYHKFKDDIEIVKNLGLDVYKFSISWSRVLPNGNVDCVNQFGIEYYGRLIDEILKNNIQPMITLYHFDLPQKLQDIGGWCNPLLIDYFTDYARLMFETFGAKVKWWTTFNEPSEIVHGYVDRRYAPYLSLECFDADYIVGHHILKAHAKVYHIYDNEFKPKQRGMVSIILCGWNFKAKTDSNDDKMAEIRARQFTMGWFAHPIYSRLGDYPPIMRKFVDEKSRKEGKNKSKLPSFTNEEINEIKGSYDFFAFNHYTSALASDNKFNARSTTYRLRDADVVVDFGKEWPRTAAHWCKVAPWGIGEMLRWIKTEYDNPPMYVTENGYCDHGEIKDIGRINYLKAYLQEVVNAINFDKCNVIGFNIWSLLDSFEWLNGFSHKFGILHVNFDSPDRERTPKLSASFIKRLCELRSIPQETYE